MQGGDKYEWMEPQCDYDDAQVILLEITMVHVPWVDYRGWVAFICVVID